MTGSEYKLVVDLAACMKKEGVGFYARQGWAGVDGVWEWDSGVSASPGSQTRGSKRQLEAAEGEGVVRGWVEDEEEEAERHEQLRQHQRRSGKSQVQLVRTCSEGLIDLFPCTSF